MSVKPRQSRAQRTLQKLMGLPHTVRALDFDPGWKFEQTKSSRWHPNHLHQFTHKDGHELHVTTDADRYHRITSIRGFVDGKEVSSDPYTGWVRNGSPEMRKPDNVKKLLTNPALLSDRKEPPKEKPKKPAEKPVRTLAIK